MVKVAGMGVLSAMAIGLLMMIFHQASSTFNGTQDPVRNEAQKVLQRAPGAAINGMKETTDAISGNPTTNAIASQSDAYRGTKTSVDTTSTIMKWLGIPWAPRDFLAALAGLLAVLGLVSGGFMG
ncbi:MAG TPA: hypothetical protein PLE93_07340, partial [Solirubrobacterales bacterium]|nr:hypothetical protein [Solirubrobacterales bacterium]